MAALAFYHIHEAAKNTEQQYHNIKQLINGVACSVIAFQRFAICISYGLSAHHSKTVKKYRNTGITHSMIKENNKLNEYKKCEYSTKYIDIITQQIR